VPEMAPADRGRAVGRSHSFSLNPTLLRKGQRKSVPRPFPFSSGITNDQYLPDESAIRAATQLFAGCPSRRDGEITRGDDQPGDRDDNEHSQREQRRRLIDIADPQKIRVELIIGRHDLDARRRSTPLGHESARSTYEGTNRTQVSEEAGCRPGRATPRGTHRSTGQDRRPPAHRRTKERSHEPRPLDPDHSSFVRSITTGPWSRPRTCCAALPWR
jgi:hypothetical protein